MAYSNPIEEDLKNGELKRFYLLYGSEEYLIEQYEKRLERHLIEEGDTMNHTRLEGDGISALQLREASETLPFFAEYRVVIIRDSLFFKKASDGIVEALEDAPDTTVFIFIEKEVDKKTKVYKFVNKNGTAAEFTEPSDKVIFSWIASRMRQNDLMIRMPVAEAIVSRVGTDMNTLDREMEKLISYSLGKNEITLEDVETLIERRAEDQVFKMIDAVSDGRKSQALKYYYDLVRLKEEPHAILALLERQYRILFIIKSLSGKRMGKDEMAKRAGTPAFTIQKLTKIAGRYKIEQIRRILELCAETEEKIKTGRMDAVLGVELLLLS